MLAIDNQIRRDYRSRHYSRFAGKRPRLTLSSQDMLSISEEIRRDYAVHKLYRPVQPASKIVLLPIDPGHLHAYWHLDDEHRRLKKDQVMMLRVHGTPEEAVNSDPMRDWFDLSVEPDCSQQQLTLPENMAGNHFWVELGWAQDDARFEPVVCSETVFAPRTPEVIREIKARRLTKNTAIKTASGLGK